MERFLTTILTANETQIFDLDNSTFQFHAFRMVSTHINIWWRCNAVAQVLWWPNWIQFVHQVRRLISTYGLSGSFIFVSESWNNAMNFMLLLCHLLFFFLWKNKISITHISKMHRSNYDTNMLKTTKDKFVNKFTASGFTA